MRSWPMMVMVESDDSLRLLMEAGTSDSPIDAALGQIMAEQ